MINGGKVCTYFMPLKMSHSETYITSFQIIEPENRTNVTRRLKYGNGIIEDKTINRSSATYQKRPNKLSWFRCMSIDVNCTIETNQDT